MDIRNALIQRVTDRFMRARAAFEKFDDVSAEREMVGPKWNVRDLAGHLVYWTDEAAKRIPEIVKSGKQPAYDFDRVNDEVYHKNRRMSFVMLLPQLRAAEDHFLAALKGVPNDLLIDSPVREWIDQVGVEHYDHHWPGLKAAAERMTNVG